MTSDDIREMLEAATPGPWWVCNYDAGDYPWYDHNGPCPSIQAPDECDCAVVHWDGFKQEYWSACDGNQKQIEANARLIAAAPDLAAEVIRLREQAALRDEADALMAHTRNAEADALRAEVERLREALREIVEHTRNSGIEVATVGERVAERCEDTALAALRAKMEGE